MRNIFLGVDGKAWLVDLPLMAGEWANELNIRPMVIINNLGEYIHTTGTGNGRVSPREQAPSYRNLLVKLSPWNQDLHIWV